jgi:hypothetical protein
MPFQENDPLLGDVEQRFAGARAWRGSNDMRGFLVVTLSLVARLRQRA